MASDIYWIDHPFSQRLAIMARPRAGDWLEDEIDHWRRDGVQIVVSLLEPDEAAELGLQAERRSCTERDIDFRAFPIPDRGVPDRADTLDFVREIAATGEAVAIHCRAGIGRSSLIAAALLVAQGMDDDDAFALIRSARGTNVPDTDAQRDWVRQFRERLTPER